MRRILVVAAIGVLVSGCAAINFGTASEGIVYYEPVPYFFVSVTEDCASTATVVSLPGPKREMKFKSGFGSSSLSAGFSNGMLTSVGQTTDANIPGALTAVTGAVAELSGPGLMADKECIPSAKLYPIVNGEPDRDRPIEFTITE